MERISIFNYEAFYLDFLEGNLNGEDTVLLMEFLDANPDLKMEDDALPLFDAEEISLNAAVKKELKQTLAEDQITMENAPFFMISSAEGLLDSAKSSELNSFIAQNKLLKQEQALYSAVYFSPDTSIIYADKKGLKHKKVIVLWPYVTAMAAACVIAFFLIWTSLNNSVIDQNDAPVMAKDIIKEKMRKNDLKNDVVDDKMNRNEGPRDKQQLADRVNPQDKKNLFVAESVENQIERKNTTVGNMEKIPVHEVLTSFNERTIEPITKKTYSSPQAIPVEQDYALVHFNEMQNPIEPITDFIGEKTKRDVDFRTSKKIAGSPGGFFLKIGQFEVSNKKF